MTEQNKPTYKRISQLIHLLFIFFLALLIPLTGYTADLNADLVSAVMEGNIANVNNLLVKGADVNAKDSHGQTILMLAAFHGDMEIVKALLAKGADVNLKNDWNSRPAGTQS